MNINENTLDELRLNQNFIMGIIGGFLGALVGAIIWAGVTIVTNHQIGWMSVGVGFLVGIGVRKLGKGIDIKFAIVGALFALFGCLLGNLFTSTYFIAKALNVDILEFAKSLTITDAVEILKVTFNVKDILFYAIAVYEGFRFGRIVLVEQKQPVKVENEAL